MKLASASVLVCAFALAACGGGGAKSAAPTATLEVAGPTPSQSATMVCASDARGDIAAAIGVDVRAVSKPTWSVARHLLACNYEYAGTSRMTLSVKELSSVAETTAYYDSLAQQLGRARSLKIAQGAFETTNGSLVVRKDYKVLLIDVSHLPAQFGQPPTDRNLVAGNIATVIMQCWDGE